VGAAAYRAGEKLQAVRSAAYRSGEGLRDEDTKIEHDYTRKQGVVYKEILLPENAPPEYADRETLWNAVEASEKRVDARLAREIEVALQIEFDLEEQKEVLREYVKENFVEKGMVADVVIHNKGDGNLNSPAEGVASGVRNQKHEFARHHAANPHSHIMLTTRNVTPEGFGNKNRDWDKKENLLVWRENWADKNNRKFEEKGLDERIDHRTLEAQGIDREPTIHLGHEAAALERQGVRTEQGDRNREIQQRNLERATQKNAEKAEHAQETAENAANTEKILVWRETEKAEPCIEESRETEKYARLEEALQRIREAQKTARYMEKLPEIDTEIESESPFISE
jgi:ATP-dependent exoDNAse (exonuclease V) alpha subunit